MFASSIWQQGSAPYNAIAVAGERGKVLRHLLTTFEGQDHLSDGSGMSNSLVNFCV